MMSSVNRLPVYIKAGSDDFKLDNNYKSFITSLIGINQNTDIQEEFEDHLDGGIYKTTAPSYEYEDNNKKINVDFVQVYPSLSVINNNNAKEYPRGYLISTHKDNKITEAVVDAFDPYVTTITKITFPIEKTCLMNLSNSKINDQDVLIKFNVNGDNVNQTALMTKHRYVGGRRPKKGQLSMTEQQEKHHRIRKALAFPTIGKRGFYGIFKSKKLLQQHKEPKQKEYYYFVIHTQQTVYLELFKENIKSKLKAGQPMTVEQFYKHTEKLKDFFKLCNLRLFNSIMLSAGAKYVLQKVEIDRSFIDMITDYDEFLKNDSGYRKDNDETEPEIRRYLNPVCSPYPLTCYLMMDPRDGNDSGDTQQPYFTELDKGFPIKNAIKPGYYIFSDGLDITFKKREPGNFFSGEFITSITHEDTSDNAEQMKFPFFYSSPQTPDIKEGFNVSPTLSVDDYEHNMSILGTMTTIDKVDVKNSIILMPMRIVLFNN